MSDSERLCAVPVTLQNTEYSTAFISDFWVMILTLPLNPLHLFFYSSRERPLLFRRIPGQCISVRLSLRERESRVVCLRLGHAACLRRVYLLPTCTRSSRHWYIIPQHTLPVVECNQMSSNACVILLMTACDCSDGDLFPSPLSPSPSGSQSGRRGPGYVNPFNCIAILVGEPS